MARYEERTAIDIIILISAAPANITSLALEFCLKLLETFDHNSQYSETSTGEKASVNKNQELL